MDSTAILVAGIAAFASVTAASIAGYVAWSKNRDDRERLAQAAAEETKEKAEDKIEDVLRERLTLRDETIASLLKDKALLETLLANCGEERRIERESLVTQISVLNAALDDCLDRRDDGQDPSGGITP